MAPADTETTTRLKTIETQGEDRETRLRALEVQSTEQRTTRALVAGLAALVFGAASTGAAIVLQDRSRLDVMESRQRELERTSRETQTDQRALATTLSELRTDLRVIGSQITDVRDRAARIEAQLAQSAGSTPTPHR